MDVAHASRFSGLSSGPNISFWYIVSRYIAARITAVAESAPISLGAGKYPTMPVAAQVLFGGERAEQHQELADEAAQPGQAAEASTITRKQAAKTGICFHRPPKSASRRVWRRS